MPSVFRWQQEGGDATVGLGDDPQAVMVSREQASSAPCVATTWSRLNKDERGTMISLTVGRLFHGLCSLREPTAGR